MTGPGSTGFVEEARGLNQERIAAIFEHPFNRELAAGTLDRERFAFFIAQDAHYVGAFSRALAVAAARATSITGHRLLIRLAVEGLDDERELHATFGVDTSIPAGPACSAYGDFLLATAACGEHAEALAAFLPCYSVYSETAEVIAAEVGPDNPYARWIETYNGEAFARSTCELEALTNEAAAAASPGLRAAMHQAYRRSVVHEWCFCNAAYTLETWPV